MHGYSRRNDEQAMGKEVRLMLMIIAIPAYGIRIKERTKTSRTLYFMLFCICIFSTSC